jgi:hypothetical protein
VRQNRSTSKLRLPDGVIAFTAGHIFQESWAALSLFQPSGFIGLRSLQANCVIGSGNSGIDSGDPRRRNQWIALR